MRFLADVGVSVSTAELLRARGHDALHLSEESLHRLPDDEILPACRELGIGLVAYSPLGRGFLSGKIRSVDDLDPSDWRRQNPRFQGENLEKNLGLADRIREIAERKGCTPAQLALAWVLAQGRDVVPIPGTRSPERLDENAASSTVALSADDLAEIRESLPPAAGLRYPEASMAAVNG